MRPSLAFVSALLVAAAAEATVRTTVTLTNPSGTSLNSKGTAQYYDWLEREAVHDIRGWHAIGSQAGVWLAFENWERTSGYWAGSLSTGGKPGDCHRAHVDAYASPSDTQGSGSSMVCIPTTSPIYEPPMEDDPGGCGYCDSPIILALDDPYRLTAVDDGVSFDLRNDGSNPRVAWTERGAKNAFLAYDRNGNGRIDNGAELFGNFTPLRSGTLARNGFEALAELDDNGDGAIDATDSIWPDLLLWIDFDHDGTSTSEELQTVDTSVVTAIETGYWWVGRTDRWGNQFRYMAHVRVRGADARRTCYDVFLQTAR